MGLKQRAFDWLDLRLGVRDILQQNLTHYLLPRNINIWYTLGATLLVLFSLQFVTGIFLLVYYVPNTEQAFASVQRIMNDIPYGWLVRFLHATGANVVILLLFLHMLSTLYMAAYKRPREITWIFGFLIFLVALAMSLTGYLLPWSQLSYWATTVATESAGATPLVGEAMIHFLRGGPAVGEFTLGRFFALHVMGLPLIFALLVGGHLFCVRRIGVSRPPFGPDYVPEAPNTTFHHTDHSGGIPFFPNYVVKDLMVIALFLTVLAAGAFFAPQLSLPPEAFEPADPFRTPSGIKPEWYFLAAYQLLRILPNEFLGLVVQGAAVAFLLFLPFIDRGPERRPARRPLFLGAFIVGLAGFLVLTVWGYLS